MGKSKAWWYWGSTERLFIRISELLNRWQKSFCKEKCKVMLLLKNNLDHPYVMFELRTGSYSSGETSLSHHWKIPKISASMDSVRQNFNRMSGIMRRIRNGGDSSALCKNLACTHTDYWVLFYSLHLKNVPMKLKMLEDKGKYNTHGAEAIKWLEEDKARWTGTRLGECGTVIQLPKFWDWEALNETRPLFTFRKKKK